jgi:hypothetical protein
VKKGKNDIEKSNGYMDYLKWENAKILTAFSIARKLNEWIGEMYNQGREPVVSLVISPYIVCLLVGDVCVWDSENNDIEDLTFDFCKEQLKEYATHLICPFE